MKNNEEQTKNYVTPIVEVVEVEVEKSFAVSEDVEGGGTGFGRG